MDISYMLSSLIGVDIIYLTHELSQFLSRYAWIGAIPFVFMMKKELNKYLKQKAEQ